MNGMALGAAFFETQGLPALRARHEEALPFLAAGLVGEGSECFGMDDALSRDHDWGPGFCVWLTDEAYRAQGAQVARTLRSLRAGAGTTSKFTRMMGPNDGRVGVFPVTGFYQRFIGFDHPPRTLREWWAVPDANLATATNGCVFCDNPGEFSAWRDALRGGYPRDVKLKKLAYCCYLALQAGPYNYPRMMRRQQRCAALLAETTFITAALRITYYLNDAYPPFYKWLEPLARSLPILGSAAARHADELAEPAANDAHRWPHAAGVMSAWCDELANVLCDSGLMATSNTSTDLYAIAVELHRAIEADWLRAIPLAVPC
ncbi:DUF4037 domain-containing protein [Eggerthella sinensis]|nr:DUF4037 domain-containing protein [Eggerthella sinensis]